MYVYIFLISKKCYQGSFKNCIQSKSGLLISCFVWLITKFRFILSSLRTNKEIAFDIFSYAFSSQIENFKSRTICFKNSKDILAFNGRGKKWVWSDVGVSMSEMSYFRWAVLLKCRWMFSVRAHGELYWQTLRYGGHATFVPQWGESVEREEEEAQSTCSGICGKF